jgi:hypothetical protein
LGRVELCSLTVHGVPLVAIGFQTALDPLPRGRLPRSAVAYPYECAPAVEVACHAAAIFARQSTVVGIVLDRLADEYRRVARDRGVLLSVRPRPRRRVPHEAFVELRQNGVARLQSTLVEQNEGWSERTADTFLVGPVVGIEQRVAHRLHRGFVDRLRGRSFRRYAVGPIGGRAATRQERGDTEDGKATSHPSKPNSARLAQKTRTAGSGSV